MSGRRKRKCRIHNDSLPEKEKMIRMGLKLSKSDNVTTAAPVFTPTLAEFHSPMKYIQSIYPQAKDFGICKIVPPKGWKVPKVDATKKRFPTRKQKINRLQEGMHYDNGRKYTVDGYQKMANQFKEKWYVDVGSYVVYCMDSKRVGRFPLKTIINTTLK